MSAWVVIPCLKKLRAEFDEVAPNRDHGSDGFIGDSSHTSSSDHTPDEDSDVLRDRDSDRENEVHAGDIDSSGVWPDGRGGEAGGWFDRKILAIVDQEKVEFESPTMVGRLQNVIWRGRIASRSWGWTWKQHNGPDGHFGHAHFSARYLTSTENDTRPWGVAPLPTKEDDMAFKDEKIEVTGTTGKELFDPDLAAGTEVYAATLLQLAAIWSRRGALDAAAIEQRLTQLEADIAAIKAAVVPASK